MIYGPLMMLVYGYTIMGMGFLNISMIDATKKKMMMKRLSECIDIYFHNKDPVTIRFAVFNIIDPKSIMTWLEIRKLIMNAGSRFRIRIEIYTAVFGGLAIGLDGIIFFTASGLLDYKMFDPLTWVYILFVGAFMTVYLLAIMYPLSYINEQSRHQISMLIQFKELIQRIVRDRRLLLSHPLRVDHRVQQLALKEYRQ